VQLIISTQSGCPAGEAGKWQEAHSLFGEHFLSLLRGSHVCSMMFDEVMIKDHCNL
jgi:hypothetical protein